MDIIIIIALIIAGAVIIQGLGALWYGPLFGKQWMKVTGRTKESMAASETNMKMMYGLSAVAGLVLSAFLFLVVAGSATVTGSTQIVISAMLTTLIVGGATSLSSYLFDERSIWVWVIHYGYMTLAAGLVTVFFVSVI